MYTLLPVQGLKLRGGPCLLLRLHVNTFPTLFHKTLTNCILSRNILVEDSSLFPLVKGMLRTHGKLELPFPQFLLYQPSKSNQLSKSSLFLQKSLRVQGVPLKYEFAQFCTVLTTEAVPEEIIQVIGIVCCQKTINQRNNHLEISTWSQSLVYHYWLMWLTKSQLQQSLNF